MVRSPPLAALQCSVHAGDASVWTAMQLVQEHAECPGRRTPCTLPHAALIIHNYYNYLQPGELLLDGETSFCHCRPTGGADPCTGPRQGCGRLLSRGRDTLHAHWLQFSGRERETLDWAAAEPAAALPDTYIKPKTLPDFITLDCNPLQCYRVRNKRMLREGTGRRGENKKLCAGWGCVLLALLGGGDIPGLMEKEKPQ